MPKASVPPDKTVVTTPVPSSFQYTAWLSWLPAAYTVGGVNVFVPAVFVDPKGRSAWSCIILFLQLKSTRKRAAAQTCLKIPAFVFIDKCLWLINILYGKKNAC